MPRKLKPTHYHSPGLLKFDVGEVAPDNLTVAGLLFYEGSHTSAEGSTDTWTKENLQAVVDATNAAIDRKGRIKLFASDDDHGNYSHGAMGGWIGSHIRLEEITADKLPFSGMTDLVGRWGIYADVQIVGEKNIRQYQSGALKELSIGIDRSGYFGIKDAIFEVSAVGFPALEGAALFGRLREHENPYALTLSLADEAADQQQQEAESQALRLWDAFSNVLWNIRNQAKKGQLPEGQTAEELRSKAIEDFVIGLRATLTPPPPSEVLPEPLTPVPLFNNPMTDNTNPTPDTQTYSAEQFQKLQDQITLQNRQIELFNRRAGLSDRLIAVRAKAQQLVAAGKMTPASFKKKFEEEGGRIPTVATYSKVEDAEAAERQLATFEQQLIKIEAVVEDLEENGTAVKFGMPVEQDLETGDQSDSADKFLETYTPKKIY